MSVEIPPGFSEEILEELRQNRMSELINGEYEHAFDDWLLAGERGEPFNPSIAIAIFPMPARGGGIVFLPQYSEYAQDHDPITAYWRRISTLSLPERANEYERKYFKELARRGDAILYANLPSLALKLLPTGLIVFSRPNPQTTTSSTESAYLFSPTLVPPSATYRHVQLQAKKHLKKLSSAM